MNPGIEHGISSEVPEWDNFLAPRSRQVVLERCATRFVLRTLEKVLRHELELHFPQSSCEERDAVVEEWYALAICGDELAVQDGPLEYHSLLQSFASAFAKADRLPLDTQWSGIVRNSISRFDDLIQQGLKSDWSWRRIEKVYIGNMLIETALRAGVDPDVPQEEVVALLEQQVADRQERVRETQEISEIPDLAPLQDTFVARMQQKLGDLWGRDPSSISTVEIDAYIKDQPGQDNSSGW
jgi:hypothetical protein